MNNDTKNKDIEFIIEKILDSMIFRAIIIILVISLITTLGIYINKHNENKKFEIIGNGIRSSDIITYDKETKVMYIRDSYGHYTVLLNPDGSPRLYEE